ncbi:MAG: response regulator [Methylococcales bacterium]|nr:response regulator [Methylococcales bacterium]
MPIRSLDRPLLASHLSVSRVLIVDNDPLMLAYIREVLEESGVDFVVETAQDSFEAGAKMNSFAPTVILLYFMLPDTDCFRICSLIKSDAVTQHIINIIAITIIGARLCSGLKGMVS